MKNITSKLITLVLIISLFFAISYLFQNRFLINHEISAIESKIDSINSILDKIDR